MGISLLLRHLEDWKIRAPPPQPAYLKSTIDWLQSKDPGAVSLTDHGSRVGCRTGAGERVVVVGEAERREGQTPLRHQLGSLPLFQDERGGGGTDLEQ